MLRRAYDWIDALSTEIILVELFLLIFAACKLVMVVRGGTQ